MLPIRLLRILLERFSCIYTLFLRLYLGMFLYNLLLLFISISLLLHSTFEDHVPLCLIFFLYFLLLVT
uniref:Putative ovule protein n=1 Tax=Solanum chacoense TaxID=4108 RepID=A0A0V0GYE5_SOLCH